MGLEKEYNLPARNGDSEGCSVCRDLLANISRFFDMLENARCAQASDWLTVDDVAKELKMSKSNVYRLIHMGGLEAVDLVIADDDNEMPQKGHYRIKRSNLNQYLEHRKVRPFPDQVTHPSRSRRPPKVKNHLGL